MAKQLLRFMFVVCGLLTANACYGSSKDLVRTEYSHPPFGHYMRPRSLNPRANELYEEAMKKLEAGDFQGAIDELTNVIAIDPREVAAYAERSYAYNHIELFQNGLDDCEKALALEPNAILALNDRGIAFRALGQYDKAMADFNHTLSIFPRNATAHIQRGYVFLDLHQPDKALADFDNAMEIPGSAKDYVYNGMSIAYTMLGKDDLSADYQARAEADKAYYRDKVYLLSLKKTALTGTDTKSGAFAEHISRAAGSINRPVKDKWALVIGISSFANHDYNLKYAAKDATDFYNYLIKDANFSADHVLLLLNEKATRQNIMNGFGDQFLPAVAQPDDLVVVFVSTHGTPKQKDKGGNNYIVAYDTDASQLYSTGVDMDELYKRIKGVTTDRALIIMDCCYSGGGVPGAKGADSGANFDAQQMAQGCGHLVISSSSPNERSWESENSPNGIFTKYLLESLRENKGKVDVKTAFEELEKKVSWEVKSTYGESQTPQLGGDWEGKELVLSVVPSEHRALMNPHLREMMKLPAQTK